MAEETTIELALKDLLDWSEGRMETTRPEYIEWKQRRGEIAGQVIAALHDAGYSIRKQGIIGFPKVTVTETTPYRADIRVDVDVMPSIVGAMQSVETYKLDDHFAEHIARHMPRILADVIERDLLQPVATDVLKAIKKFREKAPEPA